MSIHLSTPLHLSIQPSISFYVPSRSDLSPPTHSIFCSSPPISVYLPIHSFIYLHLPIDPPHSSYQSTSFHLLIHPSNALHLLTQKSISLNIPIYPNLYPFLSLITHSFIIFSPSTNTYISQSPHLSIPAPTHTSLPPSTFTHLSTSISS